MRWPGRMKSFVLITALCLTGLLAAGSAEAHIYFCVDDYYVEIPSDWHVHEQDCEDPDDPVRQILDAIQSDG